MTKPEDELPEASFAHLVSSLMTQALIELGEIENPVTKQRAPALKRARFTIDLLDVIRQRTEGNLDADEQRWIEHALHDLRMKFVKLSPKG